MGSVAPNEHTETDLDATRIEPSALSVETSRGPTRGTARQTTGPVLIRGASVGRYIIIDSLGVGGMGEVFSAYDPQLDRRIALKLVKFDPKEDSRNARDRLLREAQALAKLSHPNVVAVYDAGTHGSRVFIAMEYVEGRTLRDWLSDDAQRWSVALELVLQAGRGLAAAHAQGLVHRDFKPANVMVSEDGRVRVLDFGLARRFGEPELEAARDEPISLSGEHAMESMDGTSGQRSSLGTQLTQTGVVMGTPAYMAPEQFMGGFIDERTDQFSFCVVLYRALYGVRPFVGHTYKELGRAVTRGELLEPPKGTRVPRAIHAALRRGLSVTRDDRHPSMAALLAQLEPRGGSSRRWGLPALGVAGLAAVAGALALGTADRSTPCAGAAEQLAGVWDPARRTAMAQAFEATGMPYAEDARVATEGSLDAYAERWESLRTEVCEATRVRGDQSEVLMDLRIGCLDERLREMKALASVLVEADAEVVRNAAQGVQQLRPLPECATLDREAAARLSPEDPTEARAVADARELVAQARALLLAGKYGDGGTKARAALEQAEALGYRPVRAEAALVVGQLEERQMRAEPALAAYQRALYDATASEHTRVEAQALIGLLSIHGMHLSESDAALHYARHAAAVLERIGNPPDLLAAISLHRGTTLMGSAQLERALLSGRRAVELSEGVPEAERIHLAALNNVAAVLGQQGHYREAAKAFRRATELAEQRLGPWHPLVGNHYNNLGVTYLRLDDHERATQSLQRALEIYGEVLDPGHPEFGRVFHNLGAVQKEMGDVEAALVSNLRALELKTEGLGPDHVSVALSANNVGDVLVDLARPREAILYIEDALRIWSTAYGEDSPHNLYGLVSLSEAYLALDQPQRALAPVRRALSLAETGELDPVEVAKSDFVAAKVLWRTGNDREEARRLARRARERYQASDRPSKQELTIIDAWLADPR